MYGGDVYFYINRRDYPFQISEFSQDIKPEDYKQIIQELLSYVKNIQNIYSEFNLVFNIKNIFIKQYNNSFRIVSNESYIPNKHSIKLLIKLFQFDVNHNYNIYNSWGES